MKKFMCAFGLMLSVFTFSVTAATNPVIHTPNLTATNGNATTNRVGVLDMRQVMEKSTQIAKIRESLQKEFKPKHEKVMAAQTTLKNDTDRLRRDNAIMNNNDRKQLEQKILTEQSELQRMQTEFQKELMAQQNKALKGFLDVVKVAVEKIAKADNLSLVITKDTVAYVVPSMDITNKVVQELPRR